MNCGASYKIYDQIDLSAWLTYIDDLPDSAWDEDTFRQVLWAGEMADTKSIFFRFRDNLHGGSGVCDYPRVSEGLRLLSPIVETIRRLTNTDDVSVKSCFLVKLRAGGKVGVHKDTNIYFDLYHRFHVPLITHQDCKLLLGDDRLSMPAGTLYEINNTAVLHGADNQSSVDRILLLFDLYANWSIDR